MFKIDFTAYFDFIKAIQETYCMTKKVAQEV